MIVLLFLLAAFTLLLALFITIGTMIAFYMEIKRQSNNTTKEEIDNATIGKDNLSQMF